MSASPDTSTAPRQQAEPRKWMQVTGTTCVITQRDGWPGVWDALVSAVTGKPRLVVEKHLTVSFWTKTPDVQMAVGGVVVELNPATPQENP